MRSASPQIKFNASAVVLARMRAGLTQRRLADELGVTIRTVQNWEWGKEPSAGNFLRLADALDLSPQELYVVERAD